MQLAVLEPFEAESPRGGQRWTVAGVHEIYGRLVWKTLCGMGLRPPNLEDVYQDVFIVVQRRLDVFSGRGAMSSWLHGICRRVAAAHRRRAHVRREVLQFDELSESGVADSSTPEREVQRRPATRRLQAILSELNAAQRALLVMSELEGLTCEQMGVSAEAAYSRLRRAREAFAHCVQRQRLRATRRREVAAR